MKLNIYYFNTTIVLGTALFVGGCAKNPAENVTPAQVSAPATNATPNTLAAVPGRAYKITDASTIQFVGSKVTRSHNGGFKKFSGQFNVANGSLAPGDNKVIIETDSIYTDTDRLTGHLKSPDFFDAQKFPQAVFEAMSFEKMDGSKLKVTGNLTLHGVTKQISFPADFTVQDNAANLKAEFYIKRYDFNIKYAGKADDLIRDEVVIKLDVKAAAA